MRSVLFSQKASTSVEFIILSRSDRLRRRKMQFRVFNLLLVFALVAVVLACKKLPPKTLNAGRMQSGDNGYRLVIGNDQGDGYEPGKTYNCMCNQFTDESSVSVLSVTSQ